MIVDVVRRIGVLLLSHGGGETLGAWPCPFGTFLAS